MKILRESKDVPVAVGQVWVSDYYEFEIVDVRASYALWWEKTCFPDAGCDHIERFEEYTLLKHESGAELDFEVYEYAVSDNLFEDSWNPWESFDDADGNHRCLYRREKQVEPKAEPEKRKSYFVPTSVEVSK